MKRETILKRTDSEALFRPTFISHWSDIVSLSDPLVLLGHSMTDSRGGEDT